MPFSLTEKRSTSPSGVPSDRFPPFPGRARSGSRSREFRQPLVMKSPPGLFASPGLSTPPVGSKQTPHMNLPPSEGVLTPVETARPPNQNPSAASISSAVACNVPTFHNTAQPSEPTHIQVEAQPPLLPVRPTHVASPSGPSTSVGSRLPSLNGVSVPDVKAAHLSSRSRIKSHLKKIMTSAGQRPDPTLQTRKSIDLPERTTSQLVARLHPTVSLVPGSDFSDPVTMARLEKTGEALTHSSRVDIPMGVAGATELPGEFSGHSVDQKVLPLPPFGDAAAASASNSTARRPTRIKTKDLINRHKQRNVNDIRPTSITESAGPSQAPTSALSQTATRVGKSSANRIDNDIEIWDYDPQGATPDRRRCYDTSTNEHGSPTRGCGPTSPHPAGSPIGTKNTNNRKDGPRTSLFSKKSRLSLLGSPSPTVSL